MGMEKNNDKITFCDTNRYANKGCHCPVPVGISICVINL